MKIKEVLEQKKPTISFEVFPPKRNMDIEGIFKTIEALKPLDPDFISVTYGAGGTSKDTTIEIASRIKKEYEIETIAHLTCVTSTTQEVNETLAELKEQGIENILALRGDIPQDIPTSQLPNDFKYASDLVKHIQQNKDFSVGGACYPEGHLDAMSFEEDIWNLKRKASLGLDFLITQLFFDNETFYKFAEKCQSHGINTPIIAGILPVLSKSQILRIQQLSGCTLPKKFLRILNRYEHDPRALKEAGTAYAIEQIIDLLSWGIDGVHIYTMNKPETAAKITDAIQSIRKTLVGSEVESGII
ncbi:methylenetetrahydrofolate reductase [NAD(P)H] [Fusibacter sp. JL216-2]|uniref:methylenetetrahydrofolate reductase [NAD(P)H] n=1 Tax=Fusibacter sp. JL216-2 TaxID=3071453 RepID=UPI003D32F920